MLFRSHEPAKKQQGNIINEVWTLLWLFIYNFDILNIKLVVISHTNPYIFVHADSREFGLPVIPLVPFSH